jgi:hypothetical protein
MKSVSVTLFAGIVGYTLLHAIPEAKAARFEETVLHSFGSGADGEYPLAGLIDMKGTLYGTAIRAARLAAEPYSAWTGRPAPRPLSIPFAVNRSVWTARVHQPV